jgi:fatty acid desaturase
MEPRVEAVAGARPRGSQGAALRLRLAEAGCFRPAPVALTVHALAVLGVYAGGYLLLLRSPTPALRVLTLALVAGASVQGGIIAHDALHGAITHRRWLREAIGQLFDTFLGGFCYAHFRQIHGCHHPHCNEQAKDVDLQSAIFSLYPDAAREKRTPFARFVTRHQAYLLWPLATLQGFSLKLDALATLRRDPVGTRPDRAVILLHAALWLVLPAYLLGPAAAALNYAVVTWFIGPYTSAIFIPNHIGMRVFAPGERVPALDRQRLATRNLGDSVLSDLLLGGMNNHVEHHMFPTIPGARLRRARRITRAFCREHGLAYHEVSWLRAAREVFVYLDEIGESVDHRSERTR